MLENKADDQAKIQGIKSIQTKIVANTDEIQKSNEKIEAILKRLAVLETKVEAIINN